MNNEIRQLRADARQLAQGKFPSQVQYPDRFRRATVTRARWRLGEGGPWHAWHGHSACPSPP